MQVQLKEVVIRKNNQECCSTLNGCYLGMQIGSGGELIWRITTESGGSNAGQYC